jgi:hypothetical protein
MKKFEEKESLLHYLAKQTLWKWLDDCDHGRSKEFSPFSWRSNYGVFMELPFYETSDPYYFECSDGIIDPNKFERNEREPLSWFDPHFDRGKYLFIPDITVFHKGTPKYLIEIVNTNPVSDLKLDKICSFFQWHSLEVHQVKAKDILKKDKSCVPSSLKTELILKL